MDCGVLYPYLWFVLLFIHLKQPSIYLKPVREAMTGRKTQNTMTKTTQTRQTPQFAIDIMQQLGGSKFIAMTGSTGFVYDNQTTSISMQLRRNLAKAKWLKITLTVMDVYTMQFFALKNNEPVIVKEFNNVYNDMLQGIFTNVTGLNTSL